jgi:hypothetical protein
MVPEVGMLWMGETDRLQFTDKGMNDRWEHSCFRVSSYALMCTQAHTKSICVVHSGAP